MNSGKNGKRKKRMTKYTVNFYSKDTGKKFAYYTTHKKTEAEGIMNTPWSRAEVELVEEQYDYSGL
jgi:hypothetical protein